MSGGATNGFHKDRRNTTMTVISQRDCDPTKTPSQQAPALWVYGGALVEKSLCVLGNINTQGLVIGDVCSPQVFTDVLREKTLEQGIVVDGNLCLVPESVLKTDTIHPSTSGADVSVSGNIAISDALSVTGDSTLGGALVLSGLTPQLGNVLLSHYIEISIGGNVFKLPVGV